MKKYLLILFFLPMFMHGQGIVFEKFGDDSISMGVFIIKVFNGDTLTLNLDTISVRDFHRRLIDSTFEAKGLKRTYIVDANVGVIDSSIGADEAIYFPKYPVRDQWRMDGWVSFSNGASDSSTISFAFNQRALPTDGSWFYKFVIHTMMGGVASTTTTIAPIPAIGSTDSLTLSVKVVSTGGQHYFSMNKHLTSGLASPSSPSLVGGTNMLWQQISNTLFPSVGTSVQLRFALWFIFRRY